MSISSFKFAAFAVFCLLALQYRMAMADSAEQCASKQKFVPAVCRCPTISSSDVEFCTEYVPSLAVSSNEGDGNSGSSDRLFLVGVLVSLIAKCITNLGMVLQKLAIQRESHLPSNMRRSPTKLPLWYLGLLTYGLGVGGDSIALVFAPASVVAALGGSSLITNGIFSSLLLKESFTRYDGAAAVFIAGGATLATLSGSHSSGDYGLTTLLGLWVQPVFIAYMVILALSCTGMLVAVNRLSKRSPSANPGETPNSAFSSEEGVPVDNGGVEVSSMQGFDKQHPALKYCTVGLSALFGSLVMLFTKSAGEVFETAAGCPSLGLPSRAEPWLIVSGVIVCAVGQVHWMNKSFAICDAMFVVPLFFVLWTVNSVTAGTIYFQEFVCLGSGSIAGFFGGICLIFIGVLVLSKRQAFLDGKAGHGRTSGAGEYTHETGVVMKDLADSGSDNDKVRLVQADSIAVS